MNSAVISYRVKVLLLLAGLIVWCVLCYLLLVSPQLSALAKAKNELDGTKKKLASLQQRRAELEKTNLEVRFGTIGGKRILSSREIPGFLRDMTQLAATSNASLVRVEMSPGATEVTTSNKEQGSDGQVIEPIVKSVPLTMSFGGSFSEVYGMLARMEDYGRLMSITGITAKTSDSNPSYVEVTLPLVIYVADLNTGIMTRPGSGRTIP